MRAGEATYRVLDIDRIALLSISTMLPKLCNSVQDCTAIPPVLRCLLEVSATPRQRLLLPCGGGDGNLRQRIMVLVVRDVQGARTDI